jgi:hypothetical protein
MHDGVTFESLGRPTAVVVTKEFEHEAHVQRTALGMEGLDPVVITHPLSTLTDEEIDHRVRETVDQLERVWTGR